MFEFGRELRRWFGGETSPGPFQDGLTGGDGALLELLELDMLRTEAKAADVAAGRISAKDRPARQLEAAFVWREIARRTGDAAALRKAASHAEQAAAQAPQAKQQTQGAQRASEGRGRHARIIDDGGSRGQAAKLAGLLPEPVEAGMKPDGPQQHA